MKFLIITKQKHLPPPDMMPVLVDALAQWVAANKKKSEAVYALAGQPGGMAIASVNSLEELDDMIQSFPMNPFSDIQTIPLADIDHAMTTLREQVKKMGSLGKK